MENEKDAALSLGELAQMWGLAEPQYKTLLLDEMRTTARGNVISVKVTHYAATANGKANGKTDLYEIAYAVEEYYKSDGTPMLDWTGKPFPYYRNRKYDLPTEAEAREAAERILSGDLTQTPENPYWRNPDFEPFEI